MERQILSSVVVWMYVLLCPRHVTKLIVAQEVSFTGPTDTYMECPDVIIPGKYANFTCKVHNSFNTSICPGHDTRYKLTMELSKSGVSGTQTLCKIDAPIMVCEDASVDCGCQAVAGGIATIKAEREVKTSDAGLKVQCFSFCLFKNNTVAKNPGPSKPSCEALKIPAATTPPPPPPPAEGPNIGLIAGLVAIPIVLIAVLFLVLRKKQKRRAPPPPSSAAKPSEGGEGEEEEGEGQEEGEGGEEGGEEEDA